MSNLFARFLFHAGFLVIAAIQLLAAPPAQGQAQASCTFKLFPLPKPVSLVQVSGVNDWGTVVGSATVAGSTNGKAFIHFAGGGFSYYLPPAALGSSFFARNDSGVTTGSYTDASGNQHAFMLKGSTLTQIVDPKAVSFGTFVSGINRWNSTVGSYLDSRINGSIHGFKRYSNGSFIDLDFPVADLSLPHGTSPAGINDSGVIVGSYAADFSVNSQRGFIYHNGQWATVDAGDQYTFLNGIGNAGVIVAFTGAQSFLYANGTFKLINVPNSVMTEVDGMAPGGLISGRTLLYGFTATCH